MNPTIVIGSIASILGISSSLVSQGVNIHRELRPLQSLMQQQQQCLPPNFRLEVVVTANGQRQLVCVEQKAGQ